MRLFRSPNPIELFINCHGKLALSEEGDMNGEYVDKWIKKTNQFFSTHPIFIRWQVYSIHSLCCYESIFLFTNGQIVYYDDDHLEGPILPSETVIAIHYERTLSASYISTLEGNIYLYGPGEAKIKHTKNIDNFPHDCISFLSCAGVNLVGLTPSGRCYLWRRTKNSDHYTREDIIHPDHRRKFIHALCGTNIIGLIDDKGTPYIKTLSGKIHRYSGIDVDNLKQMIFIYRPLNQTYHLSLDQNNRIHTSNPFLKSLETLRTEWMENDANSSKLIHLHQITKKAHITTTIRLTISKEFNRSACIRELDRYQTPFVWHRRLTEDLIKILIFIRSARRQNRIHLPREIWQNEIFIHVYPPVQRAYLAFLWRCIK